LHPNIIQLKRSLRLFNDFLATVLLCRFNGHMQVKAPCTYALIVFKRHALFFCYAAYLQMPQVLCRIFKPFSTYPANQSCIGFAIFLAFLLCFLAENMKRCAHVIHLVLGGIEQRRNGAYFLATSMRASKYNRWVPCLALWWVLRLTSEKG